MVSIGITRSHGKEAVEVLGTSFLPNKIPNKSRKIIGCPKTDKQSSLLFAKDCVTSCKSKSPFFSLNVLSNFNSF